MFKKRLDFCLLKENEVSGEKEYITNSLSIGVFAQIEMFKKWLDFCLDNEVSGEKEQAENTKTVQEVNNKPQEQPQKGIVQLHL